MSGVIIITIIIFFFVAKFYNKKITKMIGTRVPIVHQKDETEPVAAEYVEFCKQKVPNSEEVMSPRLR